MPEIFRVDLPNIMHEMIDNEVVVVNLDNGTYYSFDGVGAQIWRLLGGGAWPRIVDRKSYGPIQWRPETYCRGNCGICEAVM